MTTEELIALCEQAIVPVEHWSDRDTAHSQEKIGMAWALLRAGCEWRPAGDPADTDDTIWIEISYPGFHAFEEGRHDRETWDDLLVYIPTSERLDRAAGKDWY